MREVAYDPWRFQGEALRLEAEGIGRWSSFPQSHARMVPASERLACAIIERKLRHYGDPELDRHVAPPSPSRPAEAGDSTSSAAPIRSTPCIALGMAVERASTPAPEVRVLAWL